MSSEGSYVLLHDRLQQTEAIGVKDDIEDQAHVFQRALFSLPKTYVVDETDWVTDIALGDMQWWTLIGVYQ